MSLQNTKNIFKNLYIESKLKPDSNDDKLKIINYINLGIPLNIVGMSGSGKTTFINNLINNHTTELKLDEYDDILDNEEDRIIRKTCRNKREILYNSISSLEIINKTMIVIKLHEILNTYYLFRILLEITLTHCLNEVKVSGVDDNIYRTPIDIYNERVEILDEEIKQLLNSKRCFKKNLNIVRNKLKLLNNSSRICLIIDDVNDSSLLLKYSDKINKIIEVFNETNQNYVFVSNFPINSLYSTKLSKLVLREIYLPYVFPYQILETDVFDFLKVDELSLKSLSEARYKEEDFEIDLNNNRDKSKKCKSNSRVSKKTNNSVSNIDNNNSDSYESLSNNEESFANDLILNEDIKNSKPGLIINPLTNNNKTRSVKPHKNVNKNKASKKQIKMNVTMDEFIRKSTEFFKVYVFDYNELMYFFKHYTECILSLRKKEFDNRIESYLKGTYIHFSNQLTKENRISHLENYIVYKDLLDKNLEDLKLNLSVVQKLFLISAFLSALVYQEDDLSVFLNQKIDGRKKYKKDKYSNDNGKLKKLKDGETTHITKKQNMSRVLDIFKILYSKSVFKYKRIYPRSFFDKLSGKTFPLLFNINVSKLITLLTCLFKFK